MFGNSNVKVMAHLIDKDVLVAEIEKFIERAKAERVLHPKTILAAKNYLLIEDYKKLLSTIDTLEVKEVDLKEEIDKIWKPRFSLGWDDKSLLSISYKCFEVIAKHFFELGMAVSNKEQKGE